MITYPKHNADSYQVCEHDFFSAPADLWPLIQDWIVRRRCAVFA